MKNYSASGPSSTAAQVAMAAAGLGILALLLMPLATLGRAFDSDAILVHLSGQVFNLTSDFQQATSMNPMVVVACAWSTLLLLVITFFGAMRRAKWFWITGILALFSTVIAVVLLRQGLDAEVARIASDSSLRPGAKRQLRNFYAGGGMNLGLFLPLLGSLCAIGAGLSGFPVWWKRWNRLRGLLVPLAAIVMAILVGMVVVLLVQKPMLGTEVAAHLWIQWLARADLVYFVYSTLFAPITHLEPFLESLKMATPLILTGLSVAFAFRTGLFNIGAPGQLTIGAIFAMLVGVYFPENWGGFLLPLSILGAALGGALWGAIPGLLKARFGSNEVINTIMLNYIASGIFLFLISSNTFPLFGQTFSLPFKAEGLEAQSEELHQGARLPEMMQLLNVGNEEQMKVSLGFFFALIGFGVLRVVLKSIANKTFIALAGALLIGLLTWRIGVPIEFVNSKLNGAFLIALACVALFGVLMWRTSLGYALRAVGLSPKAAEYGGISVARGTILAMTFAGMLAGLAGTHYVQGGALDDYRLKQNMPVNVGFDGIAVALMGQSTPAGVLAASVLFGTIDTGGIDVDQKLKAVNKDIVTVLKALIVLFIAAGGFLSRRIVEPPPPELLKPEESLDDSDLAASTTGGQA